MKRALAMFLVAMMTLLLAACGGKPAPSNSDAPPVVSQNTERNNSSTDKTGSQTPLDETILKDVEATIAALTAEYETLVAEIDTYDKYLENTDRMETFYEKVLSDTENLCIRMREYSVDYAEVILSSDKSNDDKYDDLDDLYDCIYDDAGDEIYDGIYDGVLDDMYDDFYDGLLDDAYDNAPYAEWSDARSDEYEWWSDTRSDVYEAWSDFRSDVYEFWPDMRSDLWGDDIERAEGTIKDFQDDIEKLKGKAEQAESGGTSTETPEDTEPTQEPEDSNSSDTLVDGMRPEFKEAMDSYEAFYDGYCDFMKEYADNPTDISLLAEYADMMSKAADMSKKFDAWDEDEMNDAELKYYLEVSNRVAQKLLEVAQ